MGGDERRPVRARRSERSVEPGRDVDVRPQADRDRVPGPLGVRIVVRELEAGDHEQVVELAGAERLRADVAQVRVVVAGVHLGRAARRMVGDSEDVEAAAPVEIAELARS